MASPSCGIGDAQWAWPIRVIYVKLKTQNEVIGRPGSDRELKKKILEPYERSRNFRVARESRNQIYALPRARLVFSRKKQKKFKKPRFFPFFAPRRAFLRLVEIY